MTTENIETLFNYHLVFISSGILPSDFRIAKSTALLGALNRTAGLVRVWSKPKAGGNLASLQGLLAGEQAHP